MDRITSMEVFAKIVETGSFSAAARQLRLSQAAASKHVQFLEAWLGARLGETAVVGRQADLAALLGAMICAGLGYGVVVLLFRTRLPLGRFAR